MLNAFQTVFLLIKVLHDVELHPYPSGVASVRRWKVATAELVRSRRRIASVVYKFRRCRLKQIRWTDIVPCMSGTNKGLTLDRYHQLDSDN